MRKTVLMLALALPAFAAQAQGFYYQSTMPDGRIIVGDKPAPGAKEAKQIPLRQGNISAPLSSPAPEGTAGASGQKPALESAEADIRDAQQELQAAKAALEAGREPLPDERTGVARKAGAKKGSSPLTQLDDAYGRRLKALEDGVTAAQKRLDDAYSRRNAAR